MEFILSCIIPLLLTITTFATAEPYFITTGGIDVTGLVNIESASLGEIKANFATDEMKGK